MSEKTCKYRLVSCSDEVPYTKNGMTSDEVENYVNRFGSMSKGQDPVVGYQEFSTFLAAKKAFNEMKENPDYCRIMDYIDNKLMDIYSIYLEEVEVDEDGEEIDSDFLDFYYPPYEKEKEVEWKKLESFQGFDLYKLGKDDVLCRVGYDVGDIVAFPEGDAPELGYEEWVAGSVGEMHDFLKNEEELVGQKKGTSVQVDPKLKEENEMER